MGMALHAAPLEKAETAISQAKDGSLIYSANKKGDKICDFSYAGYAAGLKNPPSDLNCLVSVAPLGGKKDDTAQIQAAIDKASAAPVNNNGFRGMVKLTKGVFTVNGTLIIKASGVVLKGDSAILNCRGGEMRTVLKLGGSGKIISSKKHFPVTDTYIPVGSRTIHVSDSKGLSVGMRVFISRDVTAQWIASLGMDKLVRDNNPLVWVKNGSTLDIERKIAKIANDTVTLDIPLCDSIDARSFDKIQLTPILETNRLNNIGVEGINFVTNAAKTEITAPSMSCIELLAVEDAWVRNCVLNDFMSAIECSSNTRRVTLQDNRIIRNSVIPGSAKPFDIVISGSQILVRDGSSLSKTVVFAVATVSANATFGPNAIVGYKLENDNARIEPHMRWGATGLLIQNIIGTGAVRVVNRETFGTGHGWTGANCVVWNCECPVTVENPPGYQNFAFGGKRPSGNGTIMPAQPFDLYETQLAQRRKLSPSD